MEQNTGSGKTKMFFQKNAYFLIAGLLLVGLIIYYSNQSSEETPNEQMTEETPVTEEVLGESMDETASQTPTENQPLSGNVSAEGTLLASDNPARGNLAIDSNRGTIYIQTGRDFSSLLGREVTLAAEGTLDSFVFLGFQEDTTPAVVARTDTDARGGGDELATVRIIGDLADSDDQTKGKYLIVSERGKIYLKSQRDYSSLLGLNVTLTAEGAIDSFTNATLTKN